MMSLADKMTVRLWHDGRRVEPTADPVADARHQVVPGDLVWIDILDPTPEQLAEITLMAAETVRRFGIEPRVALLSHSQFGSSNAPAAVNSTGRFAEVRRAATSAPVTDPAAIAVFSSP